MDIQTNVIMLLYRKLRYYNLLPFLCKLKWNTSISDMTNDLIEHIYLRRGLHRGWTVFRSFVHRVQFLRVFNQRMVTAITMDVYNQRSHVGPISAMRRKKTTTKTGYRRLYWECLIRSIFVYFSRGVK